MHHLDLKLLRSFATVADERSVTRAAQRLNLTQPTVSGQIKELEQTLGYLVFHRTSRSITLSEEGKCLLPLVQALLQNAEEVRLKAEALQIAALRHFKLGAAMYTMDFADRIALLDAFGKARSDLSYSIDNRLQSDQIRDLLTDRLDVALILGLAIDDPITAYTRDLPAGCIVNEVQYPASLDRVLLRRRRIGLLVPQSSALAEHAVIPAEALAEQRIAMLGGEHGHAVVDPIAAFIMQHGGAPLALAEGNAIAIERYAQRQQCCAIGIGWFATPSGMVWREVEGMNFYLDLAIVLGTNANRAARRFFEFAQRWQDDRHVDTEISGPAPCLAQNFQASAATSMH